VNEAIGEGRKIGAYECEWDIDEPQAILWSHSVASRHYPSVKWILPHSAAGTVAIKLSHEAFDNQASKQAQILSLPSKPSATNQQNVTRGSTISNTPAMSKRLRKVGFIG
jgi:hypothetical protein